MWELLKLCWDAIALRDAARKGQLTWKVWVVASGFVLAIYGIALPATLLYEKHPEDKPIFVAAMVLVGLITIAFFWFSIRHWLRSRNNQTGTPSDS